MFQVDPLVPVTQGAAIDRTLRIGQVKPVAIYRFVVTDTIADKVPADTIEEKVVALQHRERKSRFGHGRRSADIGRARRGRHSVLARGVDQVPRRGSCPRGGALGCTRSRGGQQNRSDEGARTRKVYDRLGSTTLSRSIPRKQVGGSHSGVYTVVYMATRTQIYLTDEQRARLSERAKASGRPVSELVREAIDALLAADDDLDATFGAAPGIRSKVPSRDEWERHGAVAR
jgi:predicted DNA-binding protein